MLSWWEVNLAERGANMHGDLGSINLTLTAMSIASPGVMSIAVEGRPLRTT